MTELLECLYQYVLEHASINDPEYKENLRYAAEKLRALEAVLGEESALLLTDYRFMRGAAEAAEREAVFRAALTAGISLSSAGRLAG